MMKQLCSLRPAAILVVLLLLLCLRISTVYDLSYFESDEAKVRRSFDRVFMTEDLQAKVYQELEAEGVTLHHHNRDSAGTSTIITTTTATATATTTTSETGDGSSNSNHAFKSLGKFYLYPKYKRHEGLIFLKTHKTGSSTLSGLFWRNFCTNVPSRNCFLPPRSKAGKIWDLSAGGKDRAFIRDSASGSFVLPSTSNNLGDHSHQLFYTSTTTFGEQRWRSFDAWLQHVKYSQALLETVPSSSRIVSIVRHPSKRFESAWYWYRLEQHYCLSASKATLRRRSGEDEGRRCNFTQFIDFLSTDSESKSNSNHSPNINSNLRLFNSLSMGGPSLEQMSTVSNFTFNLKYRTGLDTQSEELSGVRKGQKMLFDDAYFDLIRRVLSGRVILLVTERFDESLLAFARLLDWQLSSLIYLPQKQRLIHVDSNSSTSSSSSSRSSVDKGSNNICSQGYIPQSLLDEKSSRILEQYQPYDSLLYNLANEMLDRLIADAYYDERVGGSGGGNRDAFVRDLTSFQRGNRKFQEICREILCADSHINTNKVLDHVVADIIHHIKTNVSFANSTNSTTANTTTARLRLDYKQQHAQRVRDRDRANEFVIKRIATRNSTVLFVSIRRRFGEICSDAAMDNRDIIADVWDRVESKGRYVMREDITTNIMINSKRDKKEREGAKSEYAQHHPYSSYKEERKETFYLTSKFLTSFLFS